MRYHGNLMPYHGTINHVHNLHSLIVDGRYHSTIHHQHNLHNLAKPYGFYGSEGTAPSQAPPRPGEEECRFCAGSTAKEE